MQTKTTLRRFRSQNIPAMFSLRLIDCEPLREMPLLFQGLFHGFLRRGRHSVRPDGPGASASRPRPDCSPPRHSPETGGKLGRAESPVRGFPTGRKFRRQTSKIPLAGRHLVHVYLHPRWFIARLLYGELRRGGIMHCGDVQGGGGLRVIRRSLGMGKARGSTSVMLLTVMARMAMPPMSAPADLAPTTRACYERGKGSAQGELKFGKTLRLSRCVRNKRKLVMSNENISRIYAIETKTVRSF